MRFLGYTYVDLSWRHEYCGIFTLEYDGIPFYFLDNERFFNRDWYYGQPDDGERFAFFSKAVLEVLPVIGFKPWIIHCNDWQTGLVPVLLDAHFRHFGTRALPDHAYHHDHPQPEISGVFPKVMMDDILGLS